NSQAFQQLGCFLNTFFSNNLRVFLINKIVKNYGECCGYQASHSKHKKSNLKPFIQGHKSSITFSELNDRINGISNGKQNHTKAQHKHVRGKEVCSGHIDSH